MRSCFVSIPFGIKSDPSGRSLDFDYLYAEVIRPGVEAVEVECRRLDDYPMGAIWHKTLFEAIVGSDFVIADVSTANANVFYELGVRHALRRGRTILISAGGPLPGNISYARVLWYVPDTFRPHGSGREAMIFTSGRNGVTVWQKSSPVTGFI